MRGPLEVILLSTLDWRTLREVSHSTIGRPRQRVKLSHGQLCAYEAPFVTFWMASRPSLIVS